MADVIVKPKKDKRRKAAPEDDGKKKKKKTARVYGSAEYPLRHATRDGNPLINSPRNKPCKADLFPLQERNYDQGRKRIELDYRITLHVGMRVLCLLYNGKQIDECVQT